MNMKNDISNLLREFKIEIKEGEIFVKCETSLYPDIKDIYLISNKGRLINTKKGTLVPVRCISYGEESYSKVTLKCDGSHNNMKKRTFSVHRLLMIIFKPIDGMELLIVNHIDGDKTNNDLDNLEWCTFSYNTQHAYNHGLIKIIRGENHKNATTNEKTVIKICELFMTSLYTKQEIANICGVSFSTVVNITTGNSWNHITSKYDFSKRKTYRKSKKFSIEQIELLCEYFQNNPKDKNMSVQQYILSILKKFQLEQKIFYYSVRGIYDRKYYKNISNNYTF